MSIQVTCPCGQTLTAADTDVGQEIPCPNCGNLVKIPDPGILGYVAPAQGNPIVTPFAVDMIRQTTLWVRIMAVLMFVFSGLMVLAGGVLFLIGLSARGGGPGAILGCIYIPMAVLYIVPAVFLWRYANHTSAFAINRHEQSLESALEAQKSFWKFVAIAALVVIGIYLLIIVFAFFATVGMR